MTRAKLAVLAFVSSLALVVVYSILSDTGNNALAAGTSQVLDDHGDTIARATAVVTDGSVIQGNLEIGRDIDYFSFQVQSGQTYSVETSLGSLIDSVMTLYTVTGTVVAANDDIKPSLASRIEYAAAWTETLYVAVHSFDNSQIGTYSISIAGSQSNGAVLDDHGNTIATATAVEGRETLIHGELEKAGDLDLFSFNVQAGKDYWFDTSLGTLADSVLTLYGSSKDKLLSNDDIESGQLESAILYRSPATETIFLEVKAFNSVQSGSYTIAMRRAGWPAEMPMPPAPLPESFHPFSSQDGAGCRSFDVGGVCTTRSWFYRHPGNPSSIFVTFDGKTSNKGDHNDTINIIGEDGPIPGSPFKPWDQWYGLPLAGRTVEVPGDTVSISMSYGISQTTTTDYGFKVTKVTAIAPPILQSIKLFDSMASENRSTGYFATKTIEVYLPESRGQIVISADPDRLVPPEIDDRMKVGVNKIGNPGFGLAGFLNENDINNNPIGEQWVVDLIEWDSGPGFTIDSGWNRFTFWIENEHGGAGNNSGSTALYLIVLPATAVVESPPLSPPAKLIDAFPQANRPSGDFGSNAVKVTIPESRGPIVISSASDSLVPAGIDDRMRLVVIGPDGVRQEAVLYDNDGCNGPIGEQWVASEVIDFSAGINFIEVYLDNKYAPAGHNSSSPALYLHVLPAGAATPEPPPLISTC